MYIARKMLLVAAFYASEAPDHNSLATRTQTHAHNAKRGAEPFLGGGGVILMWNNNRHTRSWHLYSRKVRTCCFRAKSAVSR